MYDDNLSQQFDIQSHTYRIKSTEKQHDGKFSIIDNCTIFNIPVYQREYSWERGQVSRFIGDIFKGFWGTEDEKVIKKEPMFIGTMQLSYKKYINEKEYEQDVIDGQQRLSTILCILKYLQLKYPMFPLIKDIPLNWLETRVNNGKEAGYLSEMLAINNLEHIQATNNYNVNQYLQNLEVIKETFYELTIDEEGNELTFFQEHLQDFILYFLNDIYFVVVETLAGLSKTIQIFNTINTAGLDLNGNDLFKVRLYEYLHDKKNQGEDTFNEIGKIYKCIKDINSEWRKTHDWDVITMDIVRSIYQNYLISKYKLNSVLYSKATDTFFEELFDTLLNVQRHENYSGINNKGVELSLDDLTRIIKVACLWNKSKYHSIEDYISYLLIDRSRYSRYSNIAYQVLLSNEKSSENERERLTEVYELLRPLSKLFFCYSVKHARTIYEIHSFMHGLYQDVYDFSHNKENVLKNIKSKTKSNDSVWFRNECLGEPIAGNRTWKDLICLLSDYFDEIEQGTTLNELQRLFNGSYDIEHIHANANEEEGADISDDLQNSIGNLMLLEYDINRSIGCISFAEKVNRSDGGPCYKNSKYATVKKIMKNEAWTLEHIKARREEEIDKISKFLFE